MTCSFRKVKWVEQVMSGASPLSVDWKNLLHWAWRFPWDPWPITPSFSSSGISRTNMHVVNIKSVFQIREGRFQTFGQCLIREYHMSLQAFSGQISRDFCEVRVYLVLENLLYLYNFLFPSRLRKTNDMENKVWDSTEKVLGWPVAGDELNMYRLNLICLSRRQSWKSGNFPSSSYCKYYIVWDIPHFCWFHDQGVRARLVDRDFAPMVDCLIPQTFEELPQFTFYRSYIALKFNREVLQKPSDPEGSQHATSVCLRRLVQLPQPLIPFGCSGTHRA